MEIKEKIAHWVRSARKDANLSGDELGARLAIELRTARGHSKGNISHWELGKHQPSLQQLLAISKITGVPLPDEITSKFGSASNTAARPVIPLVSADQTDAPTGAIKRYAAKGSCGGGFLNHDDEFKGPLIKEASFFKNRGKPENLFAIYADGDSMADFIVDGDLVIFDETKTTPISGKIFAIQHPDGLRVKTLRRLLDGSWVLESKNPDKRRYPDEIIPAGQEGILKILGEYVYRQG